MKRNTEDQTTLPNHDITTLVHLASLALMMRDVLSADHMSEEEKQEGVRLGCVAVDAAARDASADVRSAIGAFLGC